MQSSGNNALSQLRLVPFYIVDENLTPIIARAIAACGFDITSVHEEFGRSNVDDTEIIEWLGKYGRQQSVWITADKDASKAHAKFIIAKQNSVLWIFRPKQGLSKLQELQLLPLVIEHVTDLISATQHPLYLRASLLRGKKAKLERLISSLTTKKLVFKRIPLPK